MANPADLIGTALGQYQILELLGEGGMAFVYRARQMSMGRDVAIKVLEFGRQDTDEFIRRFEREAMTVASLNHAHILKVFDYGQDQERGLAYLVMEYLRGGSLADQIAGGPMALSAIRHVLSQIAPAMDYAHQKGIIHRDLKPNNILLDEAGNYFVTDFGIVRLIYERSNLTREGTIIGTPAYIAPERWRAQPADRRADIYALGVVLYQMLTGSLPFNHNTLSGMMQLHLTKPPPPILDKRPDVPTGLVSVLEKALAKNPEDRYSWSGELMRAFEAALAVESHQAAKPLRRVDDTTMPLPAYKPERGPTQSDLHVTPEATPIARPIPKAQPVPAAKPQPAPARRASSLRDRAPILLGAGGAAVLALAVLMLAARGGGDAPSLASEPPTQTLGQVAAAAVTATDIPPTFTPSATPPLVAVVLSDTPAVSPTRTPTETPLPSPTLSETPSLTPSALPTLTPNATPTPTPTFTPAAALPPSASLPPLTPTPRATVDAEDPVAMAATQFAAQTTATHEAAAAAGIAAARAGQLVFGPASGELRHTASGQLVKFTAPGAQLRDFVAEARFINPYGAEEGAWDYGFFFRDEGANRQYRLIVRSVNQRWALFLRAGAQDSQALSSGAADGLNTLPGGSNTLRLVARGDTGWFYLNGQFVAALDLSAKQAAGSFALVTGVITGDQIAGKSTGYAEFTLAELK